MVLMPLLSRLLTLLVILTMPLFLARLTLIPIKCLSICLGYLNIYNNYFKAPWMRDRTEANPNELNQDDARYGFRCCHLKNIWTAPLPPETELSRQMKTSTTSIDIMGLQAAYANWHDEQERDYFMQRYHDVRFSRNA